MQLNSSRILVFRGGAVGDFILTIPVLTALREHRPHAGVILYCHERMSALASACRLADKVESIDGVGVSRLFVRDAGQAGGLETPVQPGDDVISYISDPDGLVRGNLLRAGAGSVAVGNPSVENGHAADWMMRPLAEIGIKVTGPAIPRLQLPAKLIEKGRQEVAELPGCGGGRAAVVIHAGSGSPKKNWPADRFAALARRLRDECGLRAVFTVGEADAAVRDALAGALREFTAVSGRNLLEVASLLGACAGYVGNDSGITHMAAALGVPTVALFGPTDPAAWGPRGSNVLIIRAPGETGGNMSGIDQDHVFKCVARHLTAPNPN